MSTKRLPTATHWGVFHAEVTDGRVVAMHPYAQDPDPSPLGQSMVSALYGGSRVDRPAVRRGYLSGKWRSDPGRRGLDDFVEVSWEQALDLAAESLAHVVEAHGNRGIFAGSYGWASAGRFHHAQSQVHRFMNTIGGYTGSRDTYSTAAGNVVLRHVLGNQQRWVVSSPGFADIADNAELVVSFGGLGSKNAQVNSGQLGRHAAREGLRRCAEAGVRFVVFSPWKQDVPGDASSRWMPLRPGTDTAVMLALAHVLVTENRHDEDFLHRYCHGFDTFRDYLLGVTDGQPKNAEWAAAISQVPADAIHALAREMADSRTLVTASWSIQRAEHGEQPYWMAATLAAILGQVGLPGRGIGYGLCTVNGVGQPKSLDWPALSQGSNPVSDFIPVARMADMLLHPGTAIDYDGQRLVYPDVQLVYWAGGNPFHHHQDINRLIQAWRRPKTIIVNEQWWTASARFADIVFPVTTALERDDIACSPMDTCLAPMHQAIAPLGERRSDYQVFSGLAQRLGSEEAFTEHRTEAQWIRFLYDGCRAVARRSGIELPGFEAFWRGGPIEVEVPTPGPGHDALQAFRRDPLQHPLGTPSGKIEIVSETVVGMGYDDCPGHPVWREPAEWLGSPAAARHPLHLLSNQPATRLHSQLDHGSVSRASKHRDREPILIHTDDARARGIESGMIVRVFNDRGACLAAAVVTDDIRAGVVQLSTGSWYDPVDFGVVGALDVHGNPNLLTQDRGTSRLAQGPSAQSALVEVERYDGELPPVTAFQAPAFG